LLGDKDSLIDWAEVNVAFSKCLNGDGGQRSEIRLLAALKIEIVVNLRDGGVVRKTVGEPERSDPGFDCVGRYERRRSVGGHFHLGCLRNRHT
jgi:hypothetical protein